MSSSSRFMRLSIGKKIIVANLTFTLLLIIILMVSYVYKQYDDIVENYINDARITTMQVESVREAMEEKWAHGVLTPKQIRTYADQDQMGKVLAMIPVVTAWETAMKKAKELDYTFKVPKFSPRNPKNQPDAVEANALKHMKATQNDSYYLIDDKLNAVRFFQAVRLSQSCLLCHGDPNNSERIWGNNKGLDPTGVAMEDWKEGEIHGAFEVIYSLDKADQEIATAIAGAGGVALVILVAGLFLAMALARNLSRPINRAAKALGATAKGDFTTHLEPSLTQRSDEIGEMLKDLEDMNQSLSDTMKSVTEVAGVVAENSRQLTQGNLDLNDRTQQQASAIEETAAALEQMTSSVRQNADSAAQANGLAQKTSEVARQGGQSVKNTMEAMQEVNESSKKIREIIDVVNEIAFQTNLLALNAAVEAARAGEAGRGFAVVAGEVRSLAGRVAEASKEIQTLITESVTKVERSSLMVSESGKLLQKIIEDTEQVTTTIAEISAASQEQATGIEEVNRAVAQMDEAVQQNAALVEEATGTSENLDSAARDLNQRMADFTIRKKQNLLPPPKKG